MDEVKKIMEEIKSKQDATTLEKLKLIRYYMNVDKLSKEEITELLKHWDAEEVNKLIEDVEKENLKPNPKRYYVSLKEPLDDATLR